MTDDEIMAIARPLGLVRGYYDENGITPNQIYAFANAVRAAALEEAAEQCATLAKSYANSSDRHIAFTCAAAIREAKS